MLWPTTSLTAYLLYRYVILPLILILLMLYKTQQLGQSPVYVPEVTSKTFYFLLLIALVRTSWHLPP